ncbi:head maturation protease, ClpP-related [Aneurinibacillus aneurinilyticus]|uniref:ATP-dependent Clp protease proteolytic subunit n=1 Tax=Aneurinibacillus aneurinilyticus ATCC 12856 TaxID=649747 RepID=U1WQM4_ANEAE|nr:head maturation protease, ClpP-related [Aneurinibacillus aneurinilyticus]ERI10899.1 endopeptidase Clp [Aneurinibacillus aneurinilyticus ATCC 12856]MED0704943.1 Clp protease ClpP [Aneurinibacillus aneurinilyticus]MED0723083.1 Clp protease ClpP [Aneurinibacillus aneurinilyticus]MED0731464.1 Clp protease ClpP [Aneurinibacillus aneurinilyticus]MED0740087.1 Clp protease ClpP [Aneurinibacillus aneurinilyticus]
MKKFWEFKNKTDDEADLYLYIEIASWGGGYYAHSAKSFKQELDNLGDIKTLNVFVNSPGGDVFEGVAIYNMLKRHKAHVNVHVDGLAASIASVIAMAADTIYMPSNAMMMIHNAWMFTAGDSNDLREAADMLDKVNTSIRQSYLDKAGDAITEEDLTALMDKESWLTAQECYDYGLCDVVGEAKQIAACTNEELFAKYRNVPDTIAKTAQKPQKKRVLSTEERQKIAQNAKTELENLKSYLGGIINA